MGTGQPTAVAPAAPKDPATGDSLGFYSVDNVTKLRSLAAEHHDVVYLAGYYTPGDGGSMFLLWDAESVVAENDGTYFEGKRTRRGRGRWRQLHDGVGDFRRFGIFDATKSADAALVAMVSDPAFHRIEAHTDLNFTRRHTFRRSNLELDFGGHLVTTEGIERNTHDNPFGAVMFFQGESAGQVHSHTLTEVMPELLDVFEVGTSAHFQVGQWWTATVNALSGRDERELQRFVKVTEIVDSSHIRVNYKNGWQFEPGRSIDWERFTPVEKISVSNMHFLGAGPYDGPLAGELPDDREYSGSHPLAFEYAVHCDVDEIHGSRTWWPVIMRRWCTFFVTKNSSLRNPPTVFYGGAGYLTQQIYCLYGHIANCQTSNARHLNDLTASAYCLVENCHGDGDDAGGNPFTTHGQYEHDLVFEGNSGLMDIANSGGQWGISAKRITVRRHTCSWFVAGTKITDLTLEDVTVIARSTFDPKATLTVNADGIQMRGCSADFFAIAQRSDRSTRPNIIEDCTFSPPKDGVLTQTPVSRPVYFRRCVIKGIDGLILRGGGQRSFVDCTLQGVAGSAPMLVSSERLVISGTRSTDVFFEFLGTVPQQVQVESGTSFTATTGTRAFLARGTTSAPITWNLGAASFEQADAGADHIAVGTGPNQLRVVGSSFIGGRLEITDAALSGDSHLLVSRCVTSKTATDLPPDGPAVVVDKLLSIN